VWTVAQVASWISAQTGRAIGLGTGWRSLQRLDRRRSAPRPRHAKAKAAAQQTCKKSS
jgi:hypothetical protein